MEYCNKNVYLDSPRSTSQTVSSELIQEMEESAKKDPKECGELSSLELKKKKKKKGSWWVITFYKNDNGYILLNTVKLKCKKKYPSTKELVDVADGRVPICFQRIVK